MTIDHLAIVYLSTSEFIRHWGVDDSECKLFRCHVESLCSIFERFRSSQVGAIYPFICSGFIDHSKRFNFCFDFVNEFNVLIVFFLISCSFLFCKLCVLCSSFCFFLLCSSSCCVFFCCVFVFLWSSSSLSSLCPCVRSLKICSENYYCLCEFISEPLHLWKFFKDSEIDDCFIEFEPQIIVLDFARNLLQPSIKSESFSHLLFNNNKFLFFESFSLSHEFEITSDLCKEDSSSCDSDCLKDSSVRHISH